MADRLLVDLDGEGQVAVAAWPEGGLPETVSQSRLVWPLDEGALEDLRWYLEDYLRAPFGVWEDRGPQIQARLVWWGEAVFGSLFGSGPARDAYHRARDRELELVFRSAEPGLLGLPWELMRDPSGPASLRLAGVGRALPTAGLAQTAAVPGGRLRVLMVISRPAGTDDVGYQLIAIVVLCTSGTEADWPDELDLTTGTFTYYGDGLDPWDPKGSRPSGRQAGSGAGTAARRRLPAGRASR